MPKVFFIDLFYLKVNIQFHLNKNDMSYSNVGKVWTPATLRETLKRYKKPSWCQSVTLHHTASPNLNQRPKGWTVQHMRNLQHFYEKKLGWKAGPHFFTDEDQIFGLSPFNRPGTHARSFNKNSIGIEVLGDYDREPAKSGRGLECWNLTAQTTAVLLEWLGKKATSKTVLFHRDDPKTSKSCPGKRIKKDWVLDLIKKSNLLEPVVDLPAEETEDKPRIPGWDNFSKINGKWFVPALDFLDHIGGDRAELIKKMKAVDGQFVYDGEVIEGAFYDKKKKATMAPALELMGF